MEIIDTTRNIFSANMSELAIGQPRIQSKGEMYQNQEPSRQVWPPSGNPFVVAVWV